MPGRAGTPAGSRRRGGAPGRSRPVSGSSRSSLLRSRSQGRQVLRGSDDSPSGALVLVGGRPLVADRYVQRRFANARWRRRIVAGRTIRLSQRARGRCWERALRRTRSARRTRGRAICRRRTVSSWRRIRISTAFAASDRRRTTTNATSRRTVQYRAEAITRRSCHRPAETATHRVSGTHRPSEGHAASGWRAVSTAVHASARGLM
jgi:hypothetical protein